MFADLNPRSPNIVALRRMLASNIGVDPLAASIYKKIALSAGGDGAYWDMTEASGIRQDTANGAVSLTQIGTVGTQTGPRGGTDIAASIASGKYLQDAASSAHVACAGVTNHCFFGWANLSSETGNVAIAGRWNAVAASTMGYLISHVSGVPTSYEGSGAYYTAAYGSAMTAGTWNFHVLWRDATDGKVRISINGSAPVVGTTATNPVDTAPLTFGAYSTGGGVMTGGLSRWGYCKGAIFSADEINWLYNGGLGRNWSEIKALAGY